MTVNEFINRYKNQDMSEKSIEEMREIIIEFRNSSGEFNLSDAKSLNNRRLELQLFNFIDIETDEEQTNFNTYVKNLLRNGRNISDEELLKEFPDEYANFEKEDTLIIDTISRLDLFQQIGGNFFNYDKTAIDKEKIRKIVNINDYNYYQRIHLYDSSYDYEFRTLFPYFAYLPELNGKYDKYKERLPEVQILRNQDLKPKMETNFKIEEQNL